MNEKSPEIKESSGFTEEEKKTRGIVMRVFLRVLAVVVILVLVFSPYLLVIDYKTYSPFVIMVWILSVVYYVFLRKRN